MKKIMALVLAVAMLTTTAFARGTGMTIGDGASTLTNTDRVAPGETLRIGEDAFNFTEAIGWRLSTEFFSISAKRFDKGANLVKEVKINDDKNTIDIVLNTNYDLVAPKGENLVIKELSIKAKKEFGKKVTGTPPTTTYVIRKGATYEYDTDNNAQSLRIGYDVAGSAQKLDNSPKYIKGELVKFEANNGVSYETASLDTEPDIYLEGRVYDGDKVYVNVNNDVDKDVLKASPDDADIRFYNIKTNGFPTANTIQLSVEEDDFIYKLVDGKLTASGLKWSEDDYAWVGKIRSGVSYVVSDIELKLAPASGTDATVGNPNTGANDVVGIAAALAVVSLVAAGAVSLKK